MYKTQTCMKPFLMIFSRSSVYTNINKGLKLIPGGHLIPTGSDNVVQVLIRNFGDLVSIKLINLFTIVNKTINKTDFNY